MSRIKKRVIIKPVLFIGSPFWLSFELLITKYRINTNASSSLLLPLALAPKDSKLYQV